MKSEISIDSIKRQSCLVQGPLAGYSCAPMRVQTWKYSQPAYCSTEMISANHLVYAEKQPERYTFRHRDEGPLCFQLSANQPETLAKATKIVDALGAEMIELNCGCPVQKIRAKGAGSKLLSEPEQLKKLMSAMRENTDALVSMKIRVAGKQDDQDNILIAEMAEQMGVDVLVVHGRHWTERYDVDCHYDQIKHIVNAVKIPVMGNGDVSDRETLKKMMDTGCAGVMIARAALGQPWLFRELEDEQYCAPSTQEIGEVFIDHIEQLAQLDNAYRAVLQSRKIGKYYARDRLVDKKSFLEKLVVCEEMNELKKIVHEHFV